MGAPTKFSLGEIIYTAVVRFKVTMLVSAKVIAVSHTNGKMQLDYIQHPDSPRHRGQGILESSDMFWLSDPMEAIRNKAK